MIIFNHAVTHKLAVSFAVASIALGAAPAVAATQGTQGSTSTGSVSINASVPNRVRISGLDDISLLNLDPSVDASTNQDVCVWSNTSTRGYSITASGSGAGDAFTLASGTETVPYSVEWASSTGQANGTALVAGSPESGLTSNATHQLCSSGPAGSASLIVKLASADLSEMQAGLTYTGTLTLLVQPE